MRLSDTLNEQRLQRVAFELVSQAVVEYAVGVAEDGRITDLQEYQDAYGFMTIAKSKVVGDAAKFQALSRSWHRPCGRIALVADTHAAAASVV